MKKSIIFFLVLSLFFNAGYSVFAAQEGLDIDENAAQEEEMTAYETILEEPFDETPETEHKKQPSKKALEKSNIAPVKKIEPEPEIPKKVQAAYKKIAKNGVLAKISNFLQTAWKKFKKFFNNLPGIRHYRNSIYSNDNYKKEMRSMAKEYKPHLQKNSAGVQILKEGIKRETE